MGAVLEYLKHLRQIRATGEAVAETSYYGALENLLNAIGHDLQPRVRAVITLRNRGAGLPDGGLFTSDQISEPTDAFQGVTLPSRGVIEVKGTGEQVDEIAERKQVIDYLNRYGQVLVTNYRDFLLVGQTANGDPIKLERFDLTQDEPTFWQSDINVLSRAHEDRLSDYLRRVMLQQAPLSDPKDVAWFLASYAREAKARVEESDLPALKEVREALEDALGITFQGEIGDRFFRSTLIQTLFYGVFSAWVLWAREHSTDRDGYFNWKEAAWYLKVPVISALFERIAVPSQLDSLRLVEILNWTGDALNRIRRGIFFERFRESQAVQYFYEPFLEAFDPELRKELGVWYTPHEIVKYMVKRVNYVLKNELGIEDGLADPSVYVLDPCCGTGAYLVEVLHCIAETLHNKGGDALLASDLKRAATERVFGFELLPAPFVVSHLQLGLILQDLGAPLLMERAERVAVYLTNALTGWDVDADEQPVLAFPELAEERDAAGQVKKKTPVLVVLGNPPYNGYAGVAVDEERALSDSYRSTNKVPKPIGQGLNDLYVRFYRMAERQIVEQTGKGIVCFISNYSWLDGLSFTGMRERYLEVFDRISIDNLNGDKYRTGKVTPQGNPDPSVFSTEINREGIQVGTAIAVLSRVSATSTRSLLYRELWGQTKLEDLVTTNHETLNDQYQRVSPVLEVGLPFMPTEAVEGYYDWPLIPDLFPVSFSGVKTSRDDFLVDVNAGELRDRIQQYFDPSISDDEIQQAYPVVMSSSRRFSARDVRRELLSRGIQSANFVRYAYRPFDYRWLYWDPDTKLLDEKRAEYFPQVFEGNHFLFTTRRTRKIVIEPAMPTSSLCDMNFLDSSARGFPAFLRNGSESLFTGTQPNLSPNASAYLEQIGGSTLELMHHCHAISQSVLFRSENADALRHDWPRIPIPRGRDQLKASATLGKTIDNLLNPETPVSTVTSGVIRTELRSIGTVASVSGTALDPEAGDLALTSGWGFRGRNGAVMPGQGQAVERDYSQEELETLEEGMAALGLNLEDALTLLGQNTLDVYANENAYWRNVPARVWAFSLGGYQVIKKWLSYRDLAVSERPLSAEEAREVMNMVRRIATVLLLEPELNANYQAVKSDEYLWPSSA